MFQESNEELCPTIKPEDTVGRLIQDMLQKDSQTVLKENDSPSASRLPSEFPKLELVAEAEKGSERNSFLSKVQRSPLAECPVPPPDSKDLESPDKKPKGEQHIEMGSVQADVNASGEVTRLNFAPGKSAIVDPRGVLLLTENGKVREAYVGGRIQAMKSGADLVDGAGEPIVSFGFEQAKQNPAWQRLVKSRQ